MLKILGHEALKESTNNNFDSMQLNHNKNKHEKGLLKSTKPFHKTVDCQNTKVKTIFDISLRDSGALNSGVHCCDKLSIFPCYRHTIKSNLHSYVLNPIRMKCKKPHRLPIYIKAPYFSETFLVSASISHIPYKVQIIIVVSYP